MRPGVRSVQVDSCADSAFAPFWLISRGSKTHLLLVPVSKVAFQKHVANLGLEAHYRRSTGEPVWDRVPGRCKRKGLLMLHRFVLMRGFSAVIRMWGLCAG